MQHGILHVGLQGIIARDNDVRPLISSQTLAILFPQPRSVPRLFRFIIFTNMYTSIESIQPVKYSQVGYSTT